MLLHLCVRNWLHSEKTLTQKNGIGRNFLGSENVILLKCKQIYTYVSTALCYARTGEDSYEIAARRSRWKNFLLFPLLYRFSVLGFICSLFFRENETTPISRNDKFVTQTCRNREELAKNGKENDTVPKAVFD